MMNVPSISHGPKGIVMWTWPTRSELEVVTGELGRVLVELEVTKFLLGASRVALEVEGRSRVDAAGWDVGKRVLVSIVHKAHEDTDATVGVTLPERASSIASVLRGPGSCIIEGRNLVENGMGGLEVDIMIIDLKQSARIPSSNRFMKVRHPLSTKLCELIPSICSIVQVSYMREIRPLAP